MGAATQMTDKRYAPRWMWMPLVGAIAAQWTTLIGHELTGTWGIRGALYPTMIAVALMAIGILMMLDNIPTGLPDHEER